MNNHEWADGGKSPEMIGTELTQRFDGRRLLRCMVILFTDKISTRMCCYDDAKKLFPSRNKKYLYKNLNKNNKRRKIFFTKNEN